MTKTCNRISVVIATVCMAIPSLVTGSYTEGNYTIAARAGIAPSSLNDKATETTIIAAGPSLNAHYSRTDLHRGFKDIYKLPFAIGMDFGYFMSNGVEVFVNFSFASSSIKKKEYVFSYQGRNLTYPSALTKDYRSIAGYVGVRNYFCTDGCFVPFFGAKLGVADLSEGKTGFSGGLQLGGDYKLADCFVLTLMSEGIITTSQKRFKKDAKIVSVTSPVQYTYSTSIGGAKTQYSFPVTLGIRFTF